MFDSSDCFSCQKHYIGYGLKKKAPLRIDVLSHHMHRDTLSFTALFRFAYTLLDAAFMQGTQKAEAQHCQQYSTRSRHRRNFRQSVRHDKRLNRKNLLL